MVDDGTTCPTARHKCGSRVEPPRPLETVVPLGGACVDVIRQLCSDSETSEDGFLSMRALAPMNGTAVCCVRLENFN